MEKYDREYLKIAIPSAMEGLFLVLLSSMDLIMIGKLGTDAINVISIFVQPRMILLCISRAFAMTVTILIAYKIGMNKEEEGKIIFQQSIFIHVVGMGIFHVFFYLCLEDILLFVGAKETYLVNALSYGKIALIAVFISSISLICQAILMGYKETKLVMKINVIGNIINMISNICLIFGIGLFPRLEVKGAAIGMVIGSLFTLCYTTTILLQKKMLLWKKGRRWIPQKCHIKELGSIFSGIILEQGSERIGMVLYSKMAAGLGSIPFAAHSICMNVCDLYYNFAQGMGKASMVLAGQANGEGKKELHQMYIKSGIKIGTLFSAVAFLICFIFRKSIVSLYTSDPLVMGMGSIIMIFVASVSFPEAQAMIASGVLRGSGKTRQVALYSFVSITVIRPILAAILIYYFQLGIYGAWISLVFDQGLRAICSSVLLFRDKK